MTVIVHRTRFNDAWVVSKEGEQRIRDNSTCYVNLGHACCAARELYPQEKVFIDERTWVANTVFMYNDPEEVLLEVKFVRKGKEDVERS